MDKIPQHIKASHCCSLIAKAIPALTEQLSCNEEAKTLEKDNSNNSIQRTKNHACDSQKSSQHLCVPSSRVSKTSSACVQWLKSPHSTQNSRTSERSSKDVCPEKSLSDATSLNFVLQFYNCNSFFSLAHRARVFATNATPRESNFLPEGQALSLC